MNRNTLLTIVVVAIVIVGFILMFNNNGNQTTNTLSKPGDKANISETPVPNVKEFAMTSSLEMVDGKPKPQFSLKEITVNKGDRVRIKITAISGMHDFKIDEYNVYADTPLNKETVVEFTADKAGEFIYYCTKPGHRQNGQWGTLKVI